MPVCTSRSKTGCEDTVGATSVDLIQIPITGSTAALMFQVACLGVDRANPSASVTYVGGQGGGINLGVITLLPNLFGGPQKSLSLITANVAVSISATFVTLTVTGVAGRTIDWTGELKILTIEP